jgi:GT2 family glycosyltransferase
MSLTDISIIIATCNREAVLWTSIEKAITAIDGFSSEIIIVNNGNQSLKIPPVFKDKVSCFDNNSRGVSAARNYGVSKSRGSFLFFADDDMWINREAMYWITNHIREDVNSGSVYNLNWEYPPYLNAQLTKTKVGNFILNAHYNTMWGRMHEKGEQPANGLYKFRHIASGSLLIHKKVFDILKGYNESLIFQGEDIDLSARINKLSVPIFCVFDVTLYHNHADRLDLDGYLQRISRGYQSQFMAEKAGVIGPSVQQYSMYKTLIFEILRRSEKCWLVLYKSIPVHPIFIPFTNRLTGLLSALQQYKQWRNIIAYNHHLPKRTGRRQ